METPPQMPQMVMRRPVMPVRHMPPVPHMMRVLVMARVMPMMARVMPMCMVSPVRWYTSLAPRASTGKVVESDWPAIARLHIPGCEVIAPRLCDDHALLVAIMQRQVEHLSMRL